MRVLRSPGRDLARPRAGGARRRPAPSRDLQDRPRGRARRRQRRRTLISLIGPGSARYSRRTARGGARPHRSGGRRRCRTRREDAGGGRSDLRRRRQRTAAQGPARRRSCRVRSRRRDPPGRVGAPSSWARDRPRHAPAEAAIHVDRAISFTKGCSSARRRSRGSATRASPTGTSAAQVAPVEAGEPLLLDGKELGRIGASSSPPGAWVRWACDRPPRSRSG